jgi:small GTP-binding protein
MPESRTRFGLTLLAALMLIGVALVFLPGWVAQQFDVARGFGTTGFYVYLSVVGLGGLILSAATITIVWRLWNRTRRKREDRRQRAKNPSQLSLAERDAELNANLAVAQDLQSELPAIESLRQQIESLSGRITEKRESQRLEIVAFGSISSGKSSLLNALAGREVFQTDTKGGTTLARNEIPWPGVDKVVLVDTPGLAEIDGVERGVISADAAKDADLVLMVVDGPLRQWEFQLLQQLGGMEKRTLICLNKSDWYTDREQQGTAGTDSSADGRPGPAAGRAGRSITGHQTQTRACVCRWQ